MIQQQIHHGGALHPSEQAQNRRTLHHPGLRKQIRIPTQFRLNGCHVVSFHRLLPLIKRIHI